MKIRANGIAIEVEDSGPGVGGAARPAVLLIMGLGMQLIAWPEDLLRPLLGAGYRVIRFDNRDIGLSQHFDELGTPNLAWQFLRLKLGLAPRAPYRLADMAADALGVLDELGVDRAHVVGVSMGGMIAQRVAIAAPKRVQSLTSIMSSSGARGLPQARREIGRALLARPKSPSRDDVADHYVQLFGMIGSPGFPQPEALLREHVLLAQDRSYHPAGTLRQLAAIVADTARAQELARIATPTLVLHGRADPLVPYPHGEDTARRIAGARLVGIDGMGHDLAPGVVERLLPPLLAHLDAARSSRPALATP
ncbi:MAG: Beta-ketoadipate enol-lactone hydrolase [Burkholderiaceae bacterium]|jgi:pimeloyl-ACP methyl ester carboxylesterase|nr:MAG: Beta-ketoadipate enol-lactone hydrolase [Burkholderiaceae bacterium]